MEKEQFEKLLLRTAFCFMACDGDIDPDEVKMIREMAQETQLFGDIDLKANLDKMLGDINELGGQFLIDYFTDLKVADLTDEEQITLIKVSIDTINADNKVEYSEIKFFKIVRDKLSVADHDILDVMPEIEEYLEQDIISPTYIAKLTADYLGSFATPTIGSLDNLAEEIEKAKNKN
ncbi:MAG: hypothetical protein GQ574_28980 [Crocinitomix sp.]|nr:hypothetical protein [Crocinitomix sp.]